MTTSFYKLAASLLIVLAGLWYWWPAPKTMTPMTAVFGGSIIQVEYATTPAVRKLGLGGRKTIPDNYGMLFVFSKDDLYGFWMKDTLVPLDIFWLNSQGQVVSIAAEVATTTFPHVFYPLIPARYVLETMAGYGRVHGIATGTPLVLKNLPSVSK